MQKHRIVYFRINIGSGLRMINLVINKISNLSIQVKASVTYMLASILTKGVNILTLPIYTRLLSTNEMGIVSNFTAWYAILYAIVTLSLTTASMSVAMIDFEEKRDQYQSVCLTISSITAVVFLFIYILFFPYINKITSLNTPLMFVQILLFFFNPALDSWYARQRFEYKYKSVLAVSSIITICSVIVSIYAIYDAQLKGINQLGTIRVIFQNAIVILFGIFFWFKIMLKGKIWWDKDMILYALKLSLPLIIHTLAKNILDVSDRLMITKLCGESEAGIYGTVYNISLMATIAWTAINSAMVPTIFSYLKEGKLLKISIIAKKILVIMALFTIIATVIAPEILRLLTTKEYYGAVYMMPAIVGGVYFTAIYGLYGDILIYYKKPNVIMISTVIVAVINIVLNYIFIQIFGYMAAAYTTFVSFVILAVMQGVMQVKVSQKHIIPVKSTILISCFTCVLCFSINIIYDKIIIRYIILFLTLLVMFAFKQKYKSE